VITADYHRRRGVPAGCQRFIVSTFDPCIIFLTCRPSCRAAVAHQAKSLLLVCWRCQGRGSPIRCKFLVPLAMLSLPNTYVEHLQDGVSLLNCAEVVLIMSYLEFRLRSPNRTHKCSCIYLSFVLSIDCKIPGPLTLRKCHNLMPNSTISWSVDVSTCIQNTLII
jgi:hypothetical protein